MHGNWLASGEHALHAWKEDRNMKYTRPLKPLMLSLAAVACITCTAAEASTVVAANPFAEEGLFGELVGIGLTAPPFYGEVQDRRTAQTFTAQTAGVVDKVAFRAANLFGYETDLRVSIASLDNGQIDQTLGSVLIDFSRVPESVPSAASGLNIAADFLSQGIALEQGRQYAIVFSTDTGEANYTLYGSRRAGASAYENGLVVRSVEGGPFDPGTSPSEDLFFAATVVPEPGAGALLLLSMAMVTRRRR